MRDGPRSLSPCRPGEVLCEICFEGKALSECRICRRSVCRDHLEERGICSVCLSAMCRVCGRSPSIASCPECGRPSCYRCLDRRRARAVCMYCRISSPPS